MTLHMNKQVPAWLCFGLFAPYHTVKIQLVKKKKLKILSKYLWKGKFQELLMRWYQANRLQSRGEKNPHKH